MNLALVISALMMGLAGSVHCVAMCGATSAAVVRGCGGASPGANRLAFHLGRLLGYAVVGALAAGSVNLLARLGQWSPALRPLWVMAHMAALGLGLWLLWKGRQPAWLDQIGRDGQRFSSATASTRGVWQRVHGPVKAGAVGSLWFSWPCGLLQSALMVAALANGPAAGAVVMSAFALASSPALIVGPALWFRWAGGRPDQGRRIGAWVTRLSGLALAGVAAWALGHDLWVRVAAYCFS